MAFCFSLEIFKSLCIFSSEVTNRYLSASDALLIFLLSLACSSSSLATSFS